MLQRAHKRRLVPLMVPFGRVSTDIFTLNVLRLELMYDEYRFIVFRFFFLKVSFFRSCNHLNDNVAKRI